MDGQVLEMRLKDSSGVKCHGGQKEHAILIVAVNASSRDILTCKIWTCSGN